MTEKEILEKQIEALEKLLQIKEAIIQEQEAKISRLEVGLSRPAPSYPWQQPAVYPGPNIAPGVINTPFIQEIDPCTDGNGHNYNYPWYSVNPQPCAKCGKVLQSGWTITSSNLAELPPDDGGLPFATIMDIANKKNV